MENTNAVSVMQADYQSLLPRLERAISACGGLRVGGAAKILIKINLCDFRGYETGAITHPVFLDGLMHLLREQFHDIPVAVVESDATSTLPDLFVKWFGFDSVFRKWDAVWCNLSRQKTFVRAINGRHFQSMHVPEVFEDAYFISLSKMKTHSLTKISCSLKNQFGCIPKRRKIAFHPYLDDAIVDANLAMRPDFSIVDGILGLGGLQGPSYGVPISSRAIVAGTDPVGVDAVCSKMMGINPRSVGHLVKAQLSGVGSASATVLGPRVDDIRTNYETNSADAPIFRFGKYLKAKAERRS